MQHLDEIVRGRGAATVGKACCSSVSGSSIGAPTSPSNLCSNWIECVRRDYEGFTTVDLSSFGKWAFVTRTGKRVPGEVVERVVGLVTQDCLPSLVVKQIHLLCRIYREALASISQLPEVIVMGAHDLHYVRDFASRKSCKRHSKNTAVQVYFFVPRGTC